MQQAIARQSAAAALIKEEMTSATGVKRPNRIAGYFDFNSIFLKYIYFIVRNNVFNKYLE